MAGWPDGIVLDLCREAFTPGRAGRAAGVPVLLRRARGPLPRRPFDADLIVLAVREAALPTLIGELAARRVVPPRAAVVHVAGVLDAEWLGRWDEY